MSREPLIPKALTRGPFTLDEARRNGLQLGHLRGSSWRRVGVATYIWSGLADDPMQRLQAAAQRLPAAAAFSGFTAGWLHLLDVSPCDPIDVTVPAALGVSARSGMTVHRRPLSKDDVVRAKGLQVVRIERALAEVCSRLSLTESVVVIDGALHRCRVRISELQSWVRARRGFYGIKSLHRALGFVEPAAESPMESRLRMILILGGLPRPRAQVPIHDRWGHFVGRPDLYFEDAGVGIEYDGGTHRNTMAEDNRRQNKLLNAGVRLLRFTASDVLGNPDATVQQVRQLLRR